MLHEALGAAWRAFVDILANPLWVFIVIPASILGALLAKGGWRKRIQWAIFGLVLPPAILWLIARRIRGSETLVEKPHVVPVPVAAPDDADDLAYVPEPADACPQCGYLGIRAPGVQDGVFPGGGELIFQVCPRCQYRGLPLRFARREDYADFLRQLNEP